MPDDDLSAAPRGGGIPLPGPRTAVPRPPSHAVPADAPQEVATDPSTATPDDSTGDAAVDQALSRLPELEGLPVREHVAVLDAVHTALQDRLADVED